MLKTTFGFLAILALAVSLKAEPTPAAAPATPLTPAQVRASIERSLPFVETKGVAWLDKQKCIACHHGEWMLWSLNEAKQAGITVDNGKVDALTARVVTMYLKDKPGFEKNHGGQVQSTYMLMSQYSDPTDATKEWRNVAASLIVGAQRKDGSWEYAGQDLDRLADENDEATTLWALLALPAGAKAEPAQITCREKAMAYLKTVKPQPGLDSLALRLAIEARFGDPSRASALKDDLIARQNSDGGWKWSEKRPSDAFATGESLYSLSLAGMKSDSPPIQKAWTFLLSTQRPDGSWLCNSRKPKGDSVISTYWGTTWAVIGLSRTLPPQAPAQAAEISPAQ